MGRQYRSPRRGASGNLFTSPAIVTSSSTAIAIPNYGVTDMSSWAAGEYVLDAPETGSRKTLVRCSTVANGGVIVRMSTTSTAGVTVGTLSGTTGANGGTQIQFDSTNDAVVVLLGINSTHWAVETMQTGLTANTTSIVIKAT